MSDNKNNNIQEEKVTIYNLYTNLYDFPIEIEVTKETVYNDEKVGKYSSFVLKNGDVIRFGNFGIFYYDSTIEETIACFSEGAIIRKELDDKFMKNNKKSKFSIF
mgnify:CR=1 FL=1